MAEILQDYLVSVKYASDAASQARFLETLKRVAVSVTGVAGEIAALGVSVLALAKHMATAGEQLYFASQRMSSSVSDIQRTAAAMSDLGVSSQQAVQSMEGLSSWTRSMGPAATAYLQRLGVTATDTAGRMQQLGDLFRRMGGSPGQEGTIGYARALRQAHVFGIDENTMRAAASGQMARSNQQYGLIQRIIWGADAKNGPQEFATQANLVMNQFRQMGFFFEQFKQKFGLALFQAVLPTLERINKMLLEMTPDLNELMKHVLDLVPKLMGYLEGAIKLLGGFVRILNVGITTLEKLPRSLQLFISAVLALPGIMRLAQSPLAWFIGALTTLLLLVEDYQGWSEGRQSALDWSAFDKMKDQIQEFAKPFLQMKEDLDAWLCNLTGIKGLTDYIIGAAALAGWLALAGRIGGVTGAASALLAVLAGPVGLAALMAAVIGGGLVLTGKSEQAAKKAIEESGLGSQYEYVDFGDPSMPNMWRNKQTGEMVETADLLKKLGYGTGTVTPTELLQGKPGGKPQEIPKEQYGPPPAPDKPSWWNRPMFGSNQIGTSFQLASAGTMFPMGAGGGAGFRSGGEFGNFLANNFGGGGGSPVSGNVGPAAGAGDLRDMLAAKLGISKEAAAGIVSNMQAESGLRADINERHPVVPGSRGGYGLVQWTGSRRVMLENWARERGLDVSSHETQVAFMQWELDKFYPNWRKTMSSGGTAAEYADRFNSLYVRAPASSRAGHVAAANNILNAPSSVRPNLNAANDSGGKYGVTVNNNASFNVTTSDPADAANRVLSGQRRANEEQTRRAAATRTR